MGCSLPRTDHFSPVSQNETKLNTINSKQKIAIGIAIVGLAALYITGFAIGGAVGIEGAAIGTLVGVWSIASLAVMVYALMRDRPSPASGTKRTWLMTVLKLPLTLFGLYIGTTLPQPGLGCFLAGLGLVYCCSVGFLVSANYE